VLNKEGEDHQRLRRLLNPAFSRRLVDALQPRFLALATELVDAFAEAGRCEFMAEFAEPYAARVIAILLGIPEDEWRLLAADSATVGLAMGVRIRADLPRIEAALANLFGYADALIAARRRRPRDDFVTRLAEAQAGPERLTTKELRDSLVLLIFGGFDTTRNQLGLAMQAFIDSPGRGHGHHRNRPAAAFRVRRRHPLLPRPPGGAGRHERGPAPARRPAARAAGVRRGDLAAAQR
jgi:cytochrome P450